MTSPSVMLTTGNETYSLDFDGTYDETVIVGEFLMDGGVVALVNAVRVKTGNQRITS